MGKWDNWIYVIMFCMLLPLGIIYYMVQFKIIIPKLRELRGKKFLDTVPGTHQWNLTREYKRLCSKNDERLIWFEVQKWNFLISIFLIVILALIFFEPVIMGQY